MKLCVKWEKKREGEGETRWSHCSPMGDKVGTARGKQGREGLVVQEKCRVQPPREP